MNEQEFLKERLDDQINWYDKKSQWNQKRYKILKIAEIIAASSIPFLTGFIDKEINYWHVLVGLLGVLIAVCSSVSALYKFHELWIEYRTVAETLKHHKYLYLTKTSPYHNDKAFELLVDVVESIISKENSNWSSINIRKDQIDNKDKTEKQK